MTSYEKQKERIIQELESTIESIKNDKSVYGTLDLKTTFHDSTITRLVLIDFQVTLIEELEWAN